MAATRKRQGAPFQDFIEEWANFANSRVEEWSGLGKRLVRQGSGEPDVVAPLQDMWMTMASAAGELANLSYKWVQSIDGLGALSREPAAASRRRTKKTAGKKRAAVKRPAGKKRAAVKRPAAKKRSAVKRPAAKKRAAVRGSKKSSGR